MKQFLAHSTMFKPSRKLQQQQQQQQQQQRHRQQQQQQTLHTLLLVQKNIININKYNKNHQ